MQRTNAPAIWGRIADTGEAVRTASELIEPLVDLPAWIEASFDPVAQERAFGPPGTAGDPAHIVDLACELVESYAAFRWSAASARALDVRPYSGAIISLREALAQLAAEPAQQIRNFMDELAQQFARVPAQLEAETPLEISMTLTLTLSAEAVQSYEDALAEVARVHRPSPFP